MANAGSWRDQDGITQKDLQTTKDLTKSGQHNTSVIKDSGGYLFTELYSANGLNTANSAKTAEQ